MIRLAAAALLAFAIGASAAQAARLHLVEVGRFDHPVYVAATSAEPGALFVVEQAGTIERVEGGKTTLFFDIARLVTSGGEQGLLSVAFSPGYATDKLFYVDYTGLNGNTIVAEYRVTTQGPVRARTLADVPDPAGNHNGGQLEFGPDGRLWWGNGDGGGQGDTYRNGQRATGFFAKIMRFDVATPGARWTTWAVGLRNPWRFSFDRATDAIYIGDVGQDHYEEIDSVPKGASHLNFGWNRYEGRTHFGHEPLLHGWRLTWPVAVYSHDEGCSVTGGYVYRGTAVAAAAGRYFYGDYCSGTVWSFAVADRTHTVRTEPFTVKGLSSFGQDAAGELYLASVESGKVFRLTG